MSHLHTQNSECFEFVLKRYADADRKLLSEKLTEVVLPKWAARCPGDCVENWNDTVGKVVGLTAKK